ncbi:SET domain-containing protein [Paraburkholderia sediminicola]|uniref:SET domain-containing protein n=1 Tax=Paraburkholderia sediminicola TaxID=458836 RepID=UPI0038BC58D1
MRRVAVRKSSIHGRGVFAVQAIPAGQRIFEYRGEVTSWRRASVRHRRSGLAGHTVIFGLADGRVIDGSVGGSSARWLNHSCEPNCEAIEDERGRIFIETIRDVMPGDELFIAYGLSTDEAITPELAADFACRCGKRRCTGSMLASASGSGVDRRPQPARVARPVLLQIHRRVTLLLVVDGCVILARRLSKLSASPLAMRSGVYLKRVTAVAQEKGREVDSVALKAEDNFEPIA